MESTWFFDDTIERTPNEKKNRFIITHTIKSGGRSSL